MRAIAIILLLTGCSPTPLQPGNQMRDESRNSGGIVLEKFGYQDQSGINTRVFKPVIENQRQYQHVLQPVYQQGLGLEQSQVVLDPEAQQLISLDHKNFQVLSGVPQQAVNVEQIPVLDQRYASIQNVAQPTGNVEQIVGGVSPFGHNQISTPSKIRQNYSYICEAGVNKHINLELYASYVYQQMSYYFNRDDIALYGFETFFKNSSTEKLTHVERLMKLQNERGGRIVLNDIAKPAKQDWASGLEAMEAALELEKSINQSLLDLHSLASKHKDPQFTDFLASNYLTEQVKKIKKLANYSTNLRRVGSGFGEYIFDKHTLSRW